jgi:triosephosphate isomerase
MRVPLIVGNWKMNETRAEARLLAQSCARNFGSVTSAEVVICPPFTALSVVAEVFRDSNILLGAQNMHYEQSGAFTGEVSGRFLKELGCSYVILGHSERRKHFGESDAIVSRKVKTALEVGLTPIVCVGETLAERDAGQTFDRLRAQFAESVASVVQKENVVVLAYEPVWAIGTGKNATAQQAAEVHQFLRSLAAERYGQAWAETLRVLYGGSVTAQNARELMQEPQIDGVLVGGASLSPDFARIVQSQSPA